VSKSWKIGCLESNEGGGGSGQEGGGKEGGGGGKELEGDYQGHGARIVARVAPS
jgi:hypothetical protein